jgi:pyruvate dehydrogenase E1 component
MFGFQRIGDLIWAAADMRCRGFLIGATAGRTTLAGEGLQHQDGHSHVLASTVPNLLTYDVAFAYELAVIIRDGIRRMYEEQENIFYYLTVENENYAMPPMPDDPNIKAGILKGMYKLKAAELEDAKFRVQLLGSGAIINEVLKAQKALEKYGIAAEVWSVTSYKELRWDGLNVERWNMLHPTETPRVPYAVQCLDETADVIVAASDYMKVLPDSISRWAGKPIVSLGTDGFGRSENRQALRDFFEVDYRYVTLSTLASLVRDEKITPDVVNAALEELEINPEKLNPMTS